MEGRVTDVSLGVEFGFVRDQDLDVVGYSDASSNMQGTLVQRALLVGTRASTPEKPDSWPASSEPLADHPGSLAAACASLRPPQPMVRLPRLWDEGFDFPAAGRREDLDE